MTPSDQGTRSVKVFRDHQEWDKHDKWWMMPRDLTRELFVARYEVPEDYFCLHLQKIESAHPGCVYVY